MNLLFYVFNMIAVFINTIFFNHSFQYAIISAVLFMLVQTIMKITWTSIDEMNTVDNVVIMSRNFAVIFMLFMALGKFLEPFGKYAESIPISKESNPSIETSVKIEIENSPPKYSANERSKAITGSRRLKNCFSTSHANMNRIG